MIVEVFVDGSADNLSDSPGGWGAVLVAGEGEARHYKELSGPIPGDPTNSAAELIAAVEGVKAVRKASGVRVLTDSKYVIKAAGWMKRVQANAELVGDLRRAVERAPAPVEFIHVKGHAGHEHQERAHALANTARLKAMAGAAEAEARESAFPEECLASRERFGNDAALFYPLISDGPRRPAAKVATPKGEGILLNAIGGLCRVLLDGAAEVEGEWDETEDETALWNTAERRKLKVKLRPTEEFAYMDVWPATAVTMAKGA